MFSVVHQLLLQSLSLLHGILYVLLAHAYLVAPPIHLLHDLVELLRRWSQSQRRICYFIFGHHDAICGVQSSGLFSILRLVKSESLVELGDVSTELLNHLNQVDVIDHDV